MVIDASQNTDASSFSNKRKCHSPSVCLFASLSPSVSLSLSYIVLFIIELVSLCFGYHSTPLW